MYKYCTLRGESEHFAENRTLTMFIWLVWHYCNQDQMLNINLKLEEYLT
jgi:hypothetical protein